MILRFLPYLWLQENRQQRWRIVISFGLVILSAALQFGLPYSLKSAVDTMNTTGPRLYRFALIYSLTFVAGTFVGVVFDNLRNIIFERVAQNATRSLAVDVFNQLHRLSLRFHLGRRTGDVVNTIQRGTKSVDATLYLIMFNIVPTALQLLGVAVIFYITFGWTLVAMTALSVASYVWVTRLITEWRTRLREKVNRLDGQALSRAVDSLLNYETVKYFGAEHREQERYSQATLAYADAQVVSENCQSLLTIAQAFVMNMLMGFAMAYTVVGWWHGYYSAGQLVFIQSYLTQLFRPLDMLGIVYRNIRQGMTDLRAMFELLNSEIEVKEVPGATALIVQRPTIVFDNVLFGYEPDRTILHGLSFEIPAGHHVALVGPSGSGKSTVARLLFRFYDPWEGRISIDGQDVATVTLASLRALLGIVPQDSVLYNDTIGYNIGYGREQASPSQIDEAARCAAIMPLIERLPRGFQTEVGERGLKLSGGEKQRVAIARALIKDPPIMIFDEATSALDSRTEREILSTLRAASERRTSLSIAHRLSTVADADRILVLAEGRILESGSHSDLMRHDGLYAEMWQRQVGEMMDLRISHAM